MEHKRQKQLEQAAKKILAMAQKQGADEVAVSLSQGQGLNTTVRLSNVETVEHNADQSLAVTVFFGQQQGSASGTDLSDSGLAQVVSAACQIAKYTQEDPYAGLAPANAHAKQWPELDLFHPWELSVPQAIALATECEQLACAVDKRIENSEGATVSTYHGMRTYADSTGFLGTVLNSRHQIDVCVIAKEAGKMQRDYSYSIARHPQDLWSLERIAHEAAKRALQRLGPKPITTGLFPVIFAADVAQGLIGHFLRAIDGDNLYRHSSFLLDSLGKSVFPPWFTLREDPFIVRGLASCPYDGEGVKVLARDLVQEGQVKGYLLDTYSGRRLNMPSTGNAGGAHNLILQSSGEDFDTLVEKLGTGLIVTEVIGQGVNLLTGDYSRGANGFWVEQGKIQHPVEEITIAGNLCQMYADIVAVGTDIESRGALQTGSILIKEMMIGA